jgi:hypothetical protein
MQRCEAESSVVKANRIGSKIRIISQMMCVCVLERVYYVCVLKGYRLVAARTQQIVRYGRRLSDFKMKTAKWWCYSDNASGHAEDCEVITY